MTRRLDSLQALRGVACLLVVWDHLGFWEQQYGINTPVVGLGKWFGFAGVDLFFALSGFLIAYTQAKHVGQPAAVPGYLFRRAWRIYPTYWVVLAVAAAAGGRVEGWTPVPPEKADWGRWAALLPLAEQNYAVGPAWTLTYEVMFYAAFAVVIALPRPAGGVLLGGWGLAVAVAVAGWLPADGPYLKTALSPFVFEFLGGVVVAGLIRRGVTQGGPAAALAGIGYAAVAAWLVAAQATAPWADVMYDPLTRVATFGPPAVLIVYAAAARGAAGYSGGPRWLLAVGDASYSIYLWHGLVGLPAIMLGCYMPHTRLPHLGWLVATATVAVGGGFVLHRLVEQPLLALGSKTKPGQRPAPRAQLVHPA